MMTVDQIKELIESKIPNCQAIVEDPMNDGVHLKATIISDEFTGKSRVQQHRIVYSALGDAFSGPLHALQMITKTPTEQKKDKSMNDALKARIDEMIQKDYGGWR